MGTGGGTRHRDQAPARCWGAGERCRARGRSLEGWGQAGASVLPRAGAAGSCVISAEAGTRGRQQAELQRERVNPEYAKLQAAPQINGDVAGPPLPAPPAASAPGRSARPRGDARCLGVMLILGVMLVYEVMLGLVVMLVLITPHTNSIFAAPTCRQGRVEHEPSELWGWGGTGRGLRVLRGSRVGAPGGPVGWGRSGCWHAVAPSLGGCQLSPCPNPKKIPRGAMGKGQEPSGKGQIHPLLGLLCLAARHLPASSALPR